MTEPRTSSTDADEPVGPARARLAVLLDLLVGDDWDLPNSNDSAARATVIQTAVAPNPTRPGETRETPTAPSRAPTES